MPAKVLDRNGVPVACDFLLDTGADHTVLTAELHRLLGLPSLPTARILGGIGGTAASVRVYVQIQLLKQDGQWINIGVEAFAFTEDNTTDLPILGRDVLNLFALVVDHPADIVCLVRDRHRYVIQES